MKVKEYREAINANLPKIRRRDDLLRLHTLSEMYARLQRNKFSNRDIEISILLRNLDNLSDRELQMLRSFIGGLEISKKRKAEKAS